MRLLTAHKILVGAAIALGLFLVPWGALQYRKTGEALSLALAIGGGVLAVGLAFYLRSVVRRYGKKLG